MMNTIRYNRWRWCEAAVKSDMLRLSSVVLCDINIESADRNSLLSKIDWLIWTELVVEVSAVDDSYEVNVESSSRADSLSWQDWDEIPTINFRSGGHSQWSGPTQSPSMQPWGQCGTHSVKLPLLRWKFFKHVQLGLKSADGVPLWHFKEHVPLININPGGNKYCFFNINCKRKTYVSYLQCIHIGSVQS